MRLAPLNQMLLCIDFSATIPEMKYILSFLCLLLLLIFARLEVVLAQPVYVSPYKVNFTVPLAELCALDRESPRNNKRLESTTPFEEWYSPRIRKKYGAWGPEPRHYPAIPGSENVPPNWKRQRVLVVAHNLTGLPYQHHHIPDWNPPKYWPWKPVAFGRNSTGVDCSDFTSWVYNYGLGIRFSSNIQKQSATVMLQGPGGEGSFEAKTILNDRGYDDLIAKLKTGDLLYIKRKGTDKVSHVIMWVGEYGHSPDNAPLVIDCTGPEHTDCLGNHIPIGVQLRPFLRDSWYYLSFSHAHRIIGEPLTVEIQPKLRARII